MPANLPPVVKPKTKTYYFEKDPKSGHKKVEVKTQFGQFVKCGLQ